MKVNNFTTLQWTENVVDAPALQGALEMRDKCVGDAMISIEDVFMLDKNAKLDRKTMRLVSIIHHW